MSQSQTRPQTRRVGMPNAAPKPSDLVATVQHLVFEPGLYTMHIGASRSSTTDLGVKLPCVRLEAVPPTPARPGRANVVNTREAGWLSPSDEPSFVLVVGGQAGAILTIYRANDGMAPPEIRLRHVFTGTGDQPPSNGAGRGPARPEPAPAGIRIDALAHVSSLGDMTDRNGNWVGRAGSGSPIEGFALTPPADFPADALEYQAILGNNWNTPWFRGGEFCGSRGLMLPLLGFRVQLKGPAAAEYECQYWGQFLGGKAVGPVTGGEACASSETPLEALRVMVVRRVQAAPAVAVEPAREPVAAPRAREPAKAKAPAAKAKRPAQPPTAKPATRAKAAPAPAARAVTNAPAPPAEPAAPASGRTPKPAAKPAPSRRGTGGKTRR